MEGGGQVHFDLDEFVEVFRELCGKLGSSVANDFLRQSVFTPNVIAIDLGGLEGCKGVANGDK